MGERGQLIKKSVVFVWRSYTLKVDVKYLHHRNSNTDNRNGLIAFADFLLSFFIVTQDKSAVGMDCRAPPFNPDFSNIRIGGKQKMAYNHGKEERKWRLWKEAEEKILREHGVDERTIEEIRTYDRQGGFQFQQAVLPMDE